MKTSHISILLAILLTLGVGLSAALLIIGPDRVEQQTVDLFQTQQSLIAEQGAMRISETFRDTQARLDEAADWLGRYGPTPGEAGKLQQSLYELSHPTDRELGLALLMSSKNGQITATGAGIDDERARALTDRRLAFESGDHTGPVKLCAHCLKRAGSVSLVAPLDDGRKLVANIRLDKMLSDIFERITRGRQAQATLLDGKGNVLFAERAPEAGDDADMIAGAADLPHVDWRVVVETPRASIAPEVRESVQTMLYAAIAIRVRETDEAGIIAVSDDGPGIDEEILDEIFEPFTSTKHGEGVEGGTGLGLWLCSEIIDQHGGTIEAANRDGGGARFTVRLPRADTVPTSSEEPDEPTDNAPGREIPG